MARVQGKMRPPEFTPRGWQPPSSALSDETPAALLLRIKVASRPFAPGVEDFQLAETEATRASKLARRHPRRAQLLERLQEHAENLELDAGTRALEKQAKQELAWRAYHVKLLALHQRRLRAAQRERQRIPGLRKPSLSASFSCAARQSAG